MYAAYFGRLPVVTRLLKYKAQVDLQDKVSCPTTLQNYNQRSDFLVGVSVEWTNRDDVRNRKRSQFYS